jgi:flavin reductase (DIM6/NTAB) family NADH-FMN oxidoreductase RutF
MLTPQLSEPAVLKAAYSTYPSGVTAVCAMRRGSPVGFAVSSFAPVSLNPPLVLVCVQHTSTTWPLLADLPRLGLSILGSSQGATCRQLASKTTDRFAGVGWTATERGAVMLDDSAAWLDCSIHEVVTAGDHDLVLLRIEALRVHPGVSPLVFHASRFHSLTAHAA